jgi:elongation factor Ts
MDITSQLVKELREKTGAGMMDCKKALVETLGEMEAAIDFLRKKGLASAQKKATRIASEGMIGHYIHTGEKLGVLVEVNCETDFAARSDDFRNMVKDIAMHIAAMNPSYVRREEVPADILEREREIARGQVPPGKPAQVIDKIIEGKLTNFYEAACLYDQKFVKDDKQTVEQAINSLIAKIGENVKVRRFDRFMTGEGLEKRSTDLAADVREALGE